LAIKCPVKSLRRLPVENRINHVTLHIIFGWAHQRPWEILHAPKKSFASQAPRKRICLRVYKSTPKANTALFSHSGFGQYRAAMLQPIDWSLVPEYAAVFVFGYLCGSIPFGVLLTRLAGAPDLRSIGSGNIGATNVLRTGRKALAAATLAGDILKGTASVGLANAMFGHRAASCAALGAFLGHLFPVWLGFRGGKGVATYIGLLLGFQAWLALLAFCAIWAAIAALTRYSSLAALVASAATPAMLWWSGNAGEAKLFLLLTALLWIMHRANIARLLRGSESKIGGKSES